MYVKVFDRAVIMVTIIGSVLGTQIGNLILDELLNEFTDSAMPIYLKAVLLIFGYPLLLGVFIAIVLIILFKIFGLKFDWRKR